MEIQKQYPDCIIAYRLGDFYEIFGDNAKLVAKEKLLGFRDRILKGERFSTLATLYSEDPGSAIKGGRQRQLY